MIRVPKGEKKKMEARVPSQSMSRPTRLLLCVHSDECKGNGVPHKPGTSLPLGPSPFPIGAGPLTRSAIASWGGRLRDAGLRVRKKKMWRQSSRVRKQTGERRCLRGDKGARGYKGKLLVHIMYCNHLRLEHSDLLC